MATIRSHKPLTVVAIIWGALGALLVIAVAAMAALQYAGPYIGSMVSSLTTSFTSTTPGSSLSGLERGNSSAKDTVSDELKELLNASYAPRDLCVDIVADNGGTVIGGVYPLFVKSLLKTPPRLWGDALSTPLEGSTPEEMRGMLERAICEEPVIGISLAHLFAHLEINGTSVLSLQKTDWLKPYAVDDSKIAELVDKAAPSALIAPKDRTDANDEAEIKAGRKYQDLATKLVFLLSRYTLGTAMPIDSTHHYSLVIGGLTADGIPEVMVNHTLDNRQALVFYLTEKTACLPISVLAFNVGDKRPELGVIPDNCETLVPPKTGCVENCGSSNCVVNCGPSLCTSYCNAKDPRDSVTPPQGVTPQPNDAPEPTAPASPSIPANPGTPPHSDPIPANHGGPAPDPGTAPPPGTPGGTMSGDPDAH